jgi:DNA topoisomerase-1
VEWLRRFYFGANGAVADPARISAQGGLKRLIESRLEEIDARGVNSIPLDNGVVVRVGRYGPYLQRGSDDASERASIPEDLAPDELTPEKVEEMLSAPSGDRSLGIGDSGSEITAKTGRYGPYVTDGERSASLFKTMSIDTVSLTDALKLLTLPRVLGVLDGEEVTAQNGRYGPYVKRGTDSRSLDAEEQLFTVTLDDAKALFAQPKTRGRRAAAAPPLREIGNDPGSGKPMVIKDGRFGPYVTDGETNASLRRGDSVEELTVDRAAELLAERRARGPAKKAPAKRAPRKAAAKKAPAKKAPAKKAAKKAEAAKE